MWKWREFRGPRWARQMERRIMGKIEDYVSKVNAANTKIESHLDGLTKDLSDLDAKISELQSASGNLTPEQDAALQAVVDSSEKIQERVAALDEARPVNITPPVDVPPTPTDVPPTDTPPSA